MIIFQDDEEGAGDGTAESGDEAGEGGDA